MLHGRDQNWPAASSNIFEGNFPLPLAGLLQFYSWTFGVWKIQDFCFLQKGAESKHKPAQGPDSNCKVRIIWAVLVSCWVNVHHSPSLWLFRNALPVSYWFFFFLVGRGGERSEIQFALKLTSKTTLGGCVNSRRTLKSQFYLFQDWPTKCYCHLAHRLKSSSK